MEYGLPEGWVSVAPFRIGDWLVQKEYLDSSVSQSSYQRLDQGPSCLSDEGRVENDPVLGLGEVEREGRIEIGFCEESD